ncbi:hypothetical protein TRVL_04259 [Trypanosoma vivax]|nr:hypothetical protein TRVL_04259 [Trypanosoma vivax]
MRDLLQQLVLDGRVSSGSGQLRRLANATRDAQGSNKQRRGENCELAGLQRKSGGCNSQLRHDEMQIHGNALSHGGDPPEGSGAALQHQTRVGDERQTAEAKKDDRTAGKHEAHDKLGIGLAPSMCGKEG